METGEERLTLTVPEVAKLLGIGRGTAYEAARIGAKRVGMRPRPSQMLLAVILSLFSKHTLHYLSFRLPLFLRIMNYTLDNTSHQALV